MIASEAHLLSKTKNSEDILIRLDEICETIESVAKNGTYSIVLDFTDTTWKPVIEGLEELGYGVSITRYCGDEKLLISWGE
jgi:hypothetical protein